MGDDHGGRSSSSSRIELDPFPGEEVLAHEGRTWKINTITKLSPYELVTVAETGIPPAARAIIDTPLDDLPELPEGHAGFEARKKERRKIIKEIQENAEKRLRITLRAWNLLFESLRSCCLKRAPILADELYENCALERSHNRPELKGNFDGPRAMRIIDKRIEGSGERTVFDKNFYKTALEFQEKNPLQNGATQAEYLKRASAFTQHIMPNLAQKFTLPDAAEYVIDLMPPELYEAGRRVRFDARAEGRLLDLQYLIRQCGSEVFRKQKGSAPKPVLVSYDALGGHDVTMMAAVTGLEGLHCSACDLPGLGAFSGVVGKSFCPKCPHPGGTCIADPNNVKPPPPSVFLDKPRWKDLMALREKNAARLGITASPVPPPSSEAMKRYTDFLEKKRKGAKKKQTPAAVAVSGAPKLEGFFGGSHEVTNDPTFIGVAVDCSGSSHETSQDSAQWVCVIGTDLHGVHPAHAISDDDVAAIEAGGEPFTISTPRRRRGPPSWSLPTTPQPRPISQQPRPTS